MMRGKQLRDLQEATVQRRRYGPGVHKVDWLPDGRWTGLG